MLNETKVDGYKLSNLSIYTDSILSPLPIFNDNRVEIYGVKGTVLVERKYEDRELILTCFLSNTSFREVNEVLREMLYRLKINQKVLINCSKDPYIFYYGQLTEILDLERTTPFTANFSLKFICDPDIYLLKNISLLNSISTVEDFNNLNEGTDYVLDINPV